MSLGKVFDEKPYAGNPYTRFDGIAVAPAATLRRGARFCKRLAMLVAAVLSASQMLMAETQTVGGYTWTYSVSGNLESVSPEPSGSLSIPSTLGGKPVTSIGDHVFAFCSAITEVTIPDGVTSIGDYAFYQCPDLTSVIFNGNAPMVGEESFTDVAANCVAHVNSLASGFPSPGETWNGLTVDYGDGVPGVVVTSDMWDYYELLRVAPGTTIRFHYDLGYIDDNFEGRGDGETMKAVVADSNYWLVLRDLREDRIPNKGYFDWTAPSEFGSVWVGFTYDDYICEDGTGRYLDDAFGFDIEVGIFHTVTFDPGEHGSWAISRGVQQVVRDGASITFTPKVRADQGWAFVGWDKSYTNVKSDLIVYARYEPIWSVTFSLGEHGTRIGGGALSQAVTNGCAAVAPVLSVANGYDFDGWDASFDHVTGDMTVRASYVRIPLSVSVTGLNAVAQQGSSALDVTFDVLCDDQAQTNYVHLVARDEGTGAEYPIRTVTGDSVFTNGHYHLTWNASADLPTGITGSIRIHAFATAHPLAHRWGFNGNYLDTAGTMDATATGNVTLADGTATLAGGTRGSSYIALGREVFPNDNQPRTIELWARQDAIKYWGTIFMVGVNTSDFLYMQWTRESSLNTDKVRIGGAMSASDQLAPYSLGVEYHIVMTLEPLGDNVWNARFYKQENATGLTLAKVNFTCTNALSLVNNSLKTFYLGHSLWSPEDDASATYDEVRIWNAALRETELTRNVLAGKDIATNSAAATSVFLSMVTFDISGHGTRAGGGELVQVVAEGGNAIAPELAVDFGWVFTGWSEPFSNVTTSVNVVAQYDFAFPFDASGAREGCLKG